MINEMVTALFRQIADHERKITQIELGLQQSVQALAGMGIAVTRMAMARPLGYPSAGGVSATVRSRD